MPDEKDKGFSGAIGLGNFPGAYFDVTDVMPSVVTNSAKRQNGKTANVGAKHSGG
jgi:hypothetical protein